MTVERRIRVGAWEITLRWPAPATGGPTEMTIRPHPDADPRLVSRGLTTGTLRAVPLPELTSDVLHSTSTRTPPVDEAREIRRMVEAAPRPGRKGRPDEFFALVAAVYSAYVDLGHSNPVHMLAEACDAPWRAAANWVHLARKKGFLGPTPERRPGGAPTPKTTRALGSR
ncbi:hypothetical protein [Actinomadura nitritigenes]|uniref:hypothetical protein n=1 Tax=Actinomadura nitritigenes TaxID=134602 RepID=UPI003D8A2216